MVLVDGQGLPLGVRLESASLSEVKLAEATLAEVRVPRPQGRPRQKPERVIADRGYDSDPLRQRLKKRGIDLIAPYRKNNLERRYEDRRKLRRYADAGINFPVLAFVCGMTVLTAILFGVGPGLAVSQTPLSEVLKDESRGGTSGAHARLRNLVVIGEIAISMVLLIGGGLMLQSLRKLLRQDPGFSAQHILTFGVNLPGASYPRAKVWPFANPNGLRFEHEFVERLRNEPGVQGVSAVSGLPATGNRSSNRFVIEGRPTQEGQEEAGMSRRVGTDYFAVMKIPLVAGRVFTSADRIDAPPVVIVNQAWVKRYAGGQDPIGQRLRLTFSPNEPFRQIVGGIGEIGR